MTKLLEILNVEIFQLKIRYFTNQHTVRLKFLVVLSHVKKIFQWGCLSSLIFQNIKKINFFLLQIHLFDNSMTEYCQKCNPIKLSVKVFRKYFHILHLQTNHTSLIYAWIKSNFTSKRAC